LQTNLLKTRMNLLSFRKNGHIGRVKNQNPKNPKRKTLGTQTLINPNPKPQTLKTPNTKNPKPKTLKYKP
jgi:hypothetical protein